MKYLKRYNESNRIEDSFIPIEVEDILLDIKDDGFTTDLSFDTLYTSATKTKVDSYYVKVKIQKIDSRKRYSSFNTEELRECCDRLVNYFGVHIDSKYSNSVTYHITNSFECWVLSPSDKDDHIPGQSFPSNFLTKGLIISFRLSNKLDFTK